MRILAIDGSLNHSGWVVMDSHDDKIDLHSYGLITIRPKNSLAMKLYHIRSEIITLVEEYDPDIAVCEDTYTGNNRLTAARLNNVKGVIISTLFELMGQDPLCVKATEARAKIGFKNGKNPKLTPWHFFSKEYNLDLDFKLANDITDACVLGWWCIKCAIEE